MIDIARPRIVAKIEQAKGAGATFIVIDKPPHADTTASKAMETADLVLIPCCPGAFDQAAIRTTVRLVQMLAKPAWVVFTTRLPYAEGIHADAAELDAGFGVPVCPYRIADRAVFRHACAAGRTVFELEPSEKATREIEHVHVWACEHINI